MFRPRMRLYLSVFLAGIFMVPTIARASITGTISGVVHDPTGAVIPSAQVTIIEVAADARASLVGPPISEVDATRNAIRRRLELLGENLRPLLTVKLESHEMAYSPKASRFGF